MMKHDASSWLAVGVMILLKVLVISATPDGPIYNPGDDGIPKIIAVQSTPAGSYVTQTVYGFLDFTTTIGNTVMVFSPQSVAPAPEPVTKPPPQTVIQTKPSVSSQIVSEIKPSKTVTQKTQEKNSPSSNSPPKKISSVVEVKTASVDPQVVNKGIVSKVNVIEGPSSVAKPKFSSKVEVVAGPTSKAVPQQRVIFTKVDVFEGPSKIENKPPSIISSHVDIFESSPSKPKEIPYVISSIVDVQSSDDEPVLIGNNIGDPEYDFLSRQPSEFVEQTYKVVNLRPSSKFHLKPRQSSDVKAKPTLIGHNKKDSIHPTGLVTKLGGTVVKDGATTVHETQVIGTYISGKYAQVLQSTSHIFTNNIKLKPTPSSSLRILKTAAPVLGKSNKNTPLLDATPAASLYEETAALPLEALFSSAQTSNLIRPSRRPALPGGSFRNRFKGRPGSRENNFESQEFEEQDIQELQTISNNNNYKKPGKYRPPVANKHYKNNKFGRTSSAVIPTVSVFSEATVTPSSAKRQYQSTRRSGNSFKPSSATDSGGYTRRGYKSRLQPSTVDSATTSTSLYKFKLVRGRWQYTTTPKPRVTIRKNNDDEIDSATSATTGAILNDVSPYLNDVVTPQARSDNLDLEISGSSGGLGHSSEEDNTTENKIDQPPVMETIKVEISTPADFKDVYYEIATIKSPYTFQVGSVKNTRYITVTSTIEKTFIEPTETAVNIASTEPLTENILATTTHLDKEHNLLDSSIATLPPIALANDAETPPLETITETFSTTTEMLKTHILPVVRGDNTTSYTLVQTYRVTRLVTATKTLPPMDVYQFVPSKTLNEFNSRLDEAGSEVYVELDTGDNNEQDGGNVAKRIFPPDLDVANIGSEFNLSDVDKLGILEGHLRLKKAHGTTTPKPVEVTTPGLSPEQLQQLAILRFLNPAAAAQIPQVVTTSKPIVKLETVFESHVVPLFNGQSTIYSTISRPVGTVSKTEYEYGTSTLTGLPVPPVNPLFPQQPQFAVTSTPVITQTMVTETESKVLKLTFGAKTAYTTLFSTKVVPTVITTYITGSVPVQPTAAPFPGFFPGAFPSFPYVG